MKGDQKEKASDIASQVADTASVPEMLYYRSLVQHIR
jgi:hypothetical protein